MKITRSNLKEKLNNIEKYSKQSDIPFSCYSKIKWL